MPPCGADAEKVVDPKVVAARPPAARARVIAHVVRVTAIVLVAHAKGTTIKNAMNAPKVASAAIVDHAKVAAADPDLVVQAVVVPLKVSGEAGAPVASPLPKRYSIASIRMVMDN